MTQLKYETQTDGPTIIMLQTIRNMPRIRAEHQPSIFPGVNSAPIKQMVLDLSVLTLVDKVAKHFLKYRDQR